MRFITLAVVAAVAALTAAPLATAESEARQVTHGFFIDPSMAPDGKRMVVVAMVDGVEQLATMTIDGADVHMLTRDAFNHEDPSWSPDGRSLAYISFEAGDQVVWVMNADGTGAHALSPREHHAIHPNWSPDSRRIIYCSNDDENPPAKNAAQIYTIDVATRALRTLVEGGVNTYPAFSPDGRRLVFRKMVDETNSEVWIANADGSDPRNLTNHAAFDGWPAWSPDGRRIAFGSDRGGNQQIWVMAPDGTGVQRLAATPGRGTAPQWSRDGGFVYFPICTRGPGESGGCEVYRVAVPSA